MAVGSYDLEALASSWDSDAEDFFAPFDVDLFHHHRYEFRLEDGFVGWESQWSNLKRLALTTRVLHPESSHIRMNQLLLWAAHAAIRMPKLEMMEYGTARAGRLRRRRPASFATASRRKTPFIAEDDLPLDEGCQAWRNNTAIITELELESDIIHLLSAFQIYAETAQRTWASLQ